MQLSAATLHLDPRWIELAHDTCSTILLDLDGIMIPFAATAEQAALGDSAAEVRVQLTDARRRVTRERKTRCGRQALRRIAVCNADRPCNTASRGPSQAWSDTDKHMVLAHPTDVASMVSSIF
ncbi:hypothetical protein BH11MYX1_BH11MYX1_07490 [soil metagenome]